MAETNLTCSNAITEKRQAVRDAGRQIARIERIMERLAPVDREGIRGFVEQINAALESLTPAERMSALDCARAEREAGQ
jgi:hypothetical protein